MWLDHITSSGLGLDVHVDGIQIARYIPRPNARRCGTRCSGTPARSNRLPGEISVVEPPDPIPNSEVKRNCADGSVGFPCESRSSPGFYTRKPPSSRWGVCFCALETCWSVLHLQPKTRARVMPVSGRSRSRWRWPRIGRAADRLDHARIAHAEPAECTGARLSR